MTSLFKPPISSFTRGYSQSPTPLHRLFRRMLTPTNGGYCGCSEAS
ncbi:hypothetical protein M8C21_026059 [Ambrosia artemisiifolia]|uniref:Uncharacterized protein n=1 Tax=Ambrosia artemisiifolia TaxID=4212 RepID=A0AAD5G2G5_AMBAR|nr:hypothetical protein M8C21_026059 [Ambrosia artemisiifolia]